MKYKRIASVSSFIKEIKQLVENPQDIIYHLSQNHFYLKSVQKFLDEYPNANEKQKEKLAVQLAHASYQNELDNKKRNVDNCKFKFYYRGHYSDKYELLPSAYRENPVKEDFYYKEIIIRAPNEFAYKGHLEQLVKMQHYDCPTRLLDITSNPLVALYFSCVNTGCKKCDNCKTGEVLMFAPLEENVLSFDSDRALILSCIPKFSVLDKEQLIESCIEVILNGETRLEESKSNVVGRLYHEIRREVPAFKDIINPFDVLTSFFVEPLKNNNRISKQDGAFIICGQDFNTDLLKHRLNSLVVIKFKVTNKKKILKELDTLGINEATLFPEVDKVAHYLKNKAKNSF